VPAGNRALAVVPLHDLTRPIADALAQAAQAIERLRARGPVLVCCALGCSRSACAVAAWLLATGRAHNVEAAIAAVRAARQTVVLDAGHVAALRELVTADVSQAQAGAAALHTDHIDAPSQIEPDAEKAVFSIRT
jgi:protein-tyrosine phosphatase